MTLTLVTGPANSSKAGEVLGAYGAAAARGALLVVPTAWDARHYERELVTDPSHRVVLGAVLTFDGLVGLIAQRVGYGGRPLSALQRDRVLAAVLARLGLHALRTPARGAGFAPAAGELIAELARSLVTPERFAAALRAWAARDVRQAPFTRELGRIYAEYVRELDRLGRVDRELFQWRALDGLRAEPERWTHPTRDAVFVYGFDELTPLQRDVVETLSRTPGVPVTVSLTYEPGRAALVAHAEAVQELRPLADEVVELGARDDWYAPASRAVLHRLERELFEDVAPTAREDRDGSVDPPPEGVVTLLEAGGERAEAELVAAEVRGLIAAGTPAQEIVVVHRSSARVADLFARVFAGYGVALTLRREIAFAATSLGRSALAAARCAWLGEQATAADLLAYLRAPGLLRDPDVADGLEAEVRRAGLTSAAQARQRLGSEPADRVGPLRELDALAAAAGEDPVGELCRLARRLLAAPHPAAAAQLHPDEEIDARALAALARAGAELGELGAPGQVAGGRALIELLAGIPVAGGPGARHGSHPSAVLLAGPAEIRARRFRAVLVCGLQEGEFPRPATPEPFLSDERRRELALVSGLALRPREDVLDGERQLFYAAISRATERVFLSYRSSDEEGNLALASPFLDDVAAVLGDRWRATRRRRLLPDVTWPADAAPTERERARADAAARAPLTGDAPEPARRLGAGALAHVRHTRVVSAGALEGYSDCPVRWLVESELGPAPLAPQPEPLARGSLIHAVLEGLMAQLGGPVTPSSVERAQEILSEQIAGLAGGADAALGAGRSDAVRAGALRAIEADVARYLAHEAALGSGWRPLELEWRFGFDDEDERSLPALVLGEGDEEVRVRGVIDRVDVEDPLGSRGGTGRAIVRDYKSGGPAPSWPVARWRPERRLQVALYMLVVRELAGLDAVAGVYQPLRGEDLRARGAFVDGTPLGPEMHDRDARTADELEAELVDAAERAVALAARLRGGDVTPCPQTCSRDGCAHPAICRSR